MFKWLREQFSNELALHKEIIILKDQEKILRQELARIHRQMDRAYKNPDTEVYIGTYYTKNLYVKTRSREENGKNNS